MLLLSCTVYYVPTCILMLILDIFSCTGGNAIDAAVGAAICAAVALPHLASLGAQTLFKVSSFYAEL